MHKKISAIILSIFILTNTAKADGFVENQGQWKGPFKWKKEVKGGDIYLQNNAITFDLYDWSPIALAHAEGAPIDPETKIKHHSFKLIFDGANPSPTFESAQQTKHYLNFFLGNDQSQWKSQIYPKKEVIYKELYPGIDLHIIDLGDHIKYEFHLKPFADPNLIRLKSEGLDDLLLQKDGSLLLKTTIQDLLEMKPEVFQEMRGNKISIESHFLVENEFISYKIGDYDRSKPLIIDPELIFSTYSGSQSDNWGFTATPDLDGFLISGSIAFGNNYPTTIGAFDVSFNQGEIDACITKYDTTGTFLIYSTYLGGSGSEMPQSMVTDNNNNTYVFGSTSSTNFPMLNNAYNSTFAGGNNVSINGISFQGGTDIYVVGFNAMGTALIGSTYLGGSLNDGINTSTELSYNYADQSRGEVNVDHNGFIYVASTTRSTNFPVTSGAFDQSHNGFQDGILVKLNPSLSNLIFSTYLGGALDDAAYSVDIALDNTVYVGGGTNSGGFPTTTGSYKPIYGGNVDGFMTRFNEFGSALLQSTFLGTPSYDQIYILQLDENEDPHYFGQTEHPGSSLIFNAAYNNVGGGQIVGHFDQALSSPVWMTQFGSSPGQPNISPTALLVDVCNSVYIAGWGGNLNNAGNGNPGSIAGLITTNDAFKQNPDIDGDFYIAVLTSDGNSLVYGSYYGGNQSGEHVDGGTSRFDRSGKVYQSVCAGCFSNDDFPIEPNPGAWSAVNGSSGCNNGVFKIDFDLPIIFADFVLPQFGCAPFTYVLNNQSKLQSNTTFYWDFGNGQTSTLANPTLTYSLPGTYSVMLVVNDPTSCNLTDTLVRDIIINSDTTYSIPSIDTCMGSIVTLGPNIDTFNIANGVIYWLPSNLVSNPTLLNPTVQVNGTQLFRLIIDYGGCQTMITQQVSLDTFPINAGRDTIICSGFTPFTITGTTFGEAETYEWSTSPDFSSVIDNDSVLNVTILNEALNYFYLRATKTSGCQMIDTVLVTISDFDIQLTPDTAVCQSNDFAIYANSKNPKNKFYYFWTNEPLSENPNATLLTDTTENFLVLNINTDTTIYLFARSRVVPDCYSTQSIDIKVSQLNQDSLNVYASADSVLFSNQVQLFGSPSEPYTYGWTGPFLNNNSIYNPLARPKDNITRYIYTVSDPDVPGCSFSDTLIIYGYDILCGEPEVFIPDAFTPNGDNDNDVFYVRGLNVREVEVRIYNRWGNEVFYSNDKDFGWDGKVNGVMQDQGVYNYYIKATCTNSKTFVKKGNLSLLEQK